MRRKGEGGRRKAQETEEQESALATSEPVERRRKVRDGAKQFSALVNLEPGERGDTKKCSRRRAAGISSGHLKTKRGMNQPGVQDAEDKESVLVNFEPREVRQVQDAENRNQL